MEKKHLQSVVAATLRRYASLCGALVLAVSGAIPAVHAQGLPAGPATVTAAESSDGEITLTWTPVPGAVGYFIGRAVQPSGFRILCQRCPAATTYVDRNITKGAKHTYTVAAIMDRGVSRRSNSNSVYPGVQEAGAGGIQDGSTGSSAGSGGSSGGSSGESSGGSASSGSSLATPRNPVASVQSNGTVTLTWSAGGTPTTAVEYQVHRAVNGGPPELAARVPGRSDRHGYSFHDREYPKPAEGGMGDEVRLAYHVEAVNSAGRSQAAVSEPVVVKKKESAGGGSAGSSGGTPGNSGSTGHSAQPPAAVCELEYRRADNGWAALGRPDGFLGAERIALSPGETKVFVTDWKYEKKPNDGTNYYGSHLRTAKNIGARPVSVLLKGAPEVHLRREGPLATADTFKKQLLQIVFKGGFKLEFGPGDAAHLRHDLMEVTCPK